MGSWRIVQRALTRMWAVPQRTFIATRAAPGSEPMEETASPPLVRRSIASPLGPLWAVASARGLRSLGWGAAPAAADRGDGEHHLDALGEQLARYFDGGLGRFDLALDPVGTPFQRAAWRALAEVPYGATRTYAEQAAAMGRLDAVRAVGRANGQNPLAIVLPCHRIVGADGSLTGYAGGLERKARLLALERGQGELF